MPVIVIFASGNGSNALRLCQYFSYHPAIKVAAIFCNNPQASVIEKAEALDLPVVLFTREELYESNKVLDALKHYHADYIVLAGFLWLMPQHILHEFHDRIINIHPALLPRYGGKGMYGMRVHKAVIDQQEKESGITIHLVNEHYDEGRILFQATAVIEEEETPESLAQKIHKLEHEHFPTVVEEYISQNVWK